MASILLRGRHLVLTRIAALWLIVLIVSPFSAPFSTCDLATLTRSNITHAGGPVRSPTPFRSLEDAAASHAVPVAPVASRLKLLSAADLRSCAPAFVPFMPRDVTISATAASEKVASVFSPPLRV